MRFSTKGIRSMSLGTEILKSGMSFLSSKGTCFTWVTADTIRGTQERLNFRVIASKGQCCRINISGQGRKTFTSLDDQNFNLDIFCSILQMGKLRLRESEPLALLCVTELRTARMCGS